MIDALWNIAGLIDDDTIMIGLRSNDIPFALLFFNLGVEAGRLLFVVILIALNQLVRDTVRKRVPQL